MPGTPKDHESKAAWTETFRLIDDHFVIHKGAVNGRATAKGHRSASILSNASFFSEASTVVDFAVRESVQPQQAPSPLRSAHHRHVSPSGKAAEYQLQAAAVASVSPLKPASPRSHEYGQRLRRLAESLSKSKPPVRIQADGLPADRAGCSSGPIADRTTSSSGPIECKPKSDRIQIKTISPDADDLPSPGSRRFWRQCVSCTGLFNRNLSDKATMATAQLVVRTRGAEMPNGLCDHCAVHGKASQPPEARKAITNLLALSEEALLARIATTGLVLTSESPNGKVPRSPARPSVSIVHERRKRPTSSPPFVSLRKEALGFPVSSSLAPRRLNS
jgi:hypothetical protein